MSDNIFYFIKCTQENINQKKYLCYYILEIKKCTVHKVYKLYNEKLDENCIPPFQDITSLVSFVIKRDGKISLDINI